MNKRSLLTTLIALFACQTMYSQSASNEKPAFGISFKGFVKTDLMFDSRQTVTAREGHFLLYPAPIVEDVNGEDINASASYNMLSVQTRLTGVITGPEAMSAKTSGVIEGAFFGHSDGDINGFRLRHALVKLDWERSSLLIGQYWNPMFIVEVFPDVISFNTGVPFQPFSRNPQIRFVQTISDLKLTLTAASQRDFTSTGPAGASSKYLRDAVIPIMDANLKYVSPEMVAGIGANYKTLKPQLVTAKKYKSEETISSVSAMAFAKVTSGNFTAKIEGVYGENLYDLMMLGGYAEKSILDSSSITSYTNIQTISAWTELIYGSDLQFGLFAGYTKNLGSADEIVGQYYSRGSNIASVMRISPRVQYTIGKLSFAAELEYTSAEYGLPNEKGLEEHLKNPDGSAKSAVESVANMRVLFAAYLFF